MQWFSGERVEWAVKSLRFRLNESVYSQPLASHPLCRYAAHQYYRRVYFSPFQLSDKDICLAFTSNYYWWQHIICQAHNNLNLEYTWILVHKPCCMNVVSPRSLRRSRSSQSCADFSYRKRYIFLYFFLFFPHFYQFCTCNIRCFIWFSASALDKRSLQSSL